MLLCDVPVQENFHRNGSLRLVPVSDHDLPSFQKILDHSKSKDPYARSATYFAMTGRKGLWIAQNAETTIILCQHPNVENEILLFPPIGEINYNFLETVIRAIQKTGNIVKMARFTDDDLEYVPANHAAPAREDILDWLYPVHTIDTQAIAEHKGSAFQQIRTDLNKLAQDDIQVSDFDPVLHNSMVLQVAKTWSDQDPEVVDLYQRLIDLKKFLPIEGRVIFKDGKPIAFSLWEETHADSKFANTFAMLADSRINGLSRFLIVDMCTSLHKKGFNLTCVGGSESEGLDKFKKLLRPVHSIALSTLVPGREISKNPSYQAENGQQYLNRQYGS